MDPHRSTVFAAVLCILTLDAALAARADFTISFYLGASQTRPSDLRVTQPSRGNDATMQRVPWPGYPFRFEPYYGIRLTYAPSGHSWQRIALDFTHYKIYARTEDEVDQTGAWHGAAIHGAAQMRERVQSFEMTHGLNMLGLTFMHAFSAGSNGVYLGAGPVMYVPHTESTVDELQAHARYDFAGFGFQTVGGAGLCAGRHQIFSELKYNTGHPQVSIAQGHAQTTLHTLHELAGLNFGSCSTR
ncbi:MAG: hypothetical protein ACXWNK_09015 [Vulcanimicrobiaceae bacterium]